jgi:hypothetical protein
MKSFALLPSSDCFSVLISDCSLPQLIVFSADKVLFGICNHCCWARKTWSANWGLHVQVMNAVNICNSWRSQIAKCFELFCDNVQIITTMYKLPTRGTCMLLIGKCLQICYKCLEILHQKIR